MPREIEAKHRVKSHEPLRKKLTADGCSPVFRVIETNRIFDTADGRLRRAGVGLRVRSAHVLQGPNQPATLTFKGPVAAGPFKSREEIEVEFSDANSMAQLLQALGFEMVLEYRKRRERWIWGKCHVELDELPLLGRFVEVEGPDEAVIGAARDALGLAGLPMIRQSYVGLLLKRLASSDSASRRIDFAAGDAGTDTPNDI